MNSKKEDKRRKAYVNLALIALPLPVTELFIVQILINNCSNSNECHSLIM